MSDGRKIVKKVKTDHMKYKPYMEIIDSSIMDTVLHMVDNYDYNHYTKEEINEILIKDNLTIEDFGALLSPAAFPLLEQMAQKAKHETQKHFGNSVSIFTPLYIANYCENYCVYCGFNCHNKIRRAKLTMEEIEKELKNISETGLQDILLLTGESRRMSDVNYIGEAVKLAANYFNLVGIEIYPLNTEEYAYIHDCGADYVCVY